MPVERPRKPTQRCALQPRLLRRACSPRRRSSLLAQRRHKRSGLRSYRADANGVGLGRNPFPANMDIATSRRVVNTGPLSQCDVVVAGCVAKESIISFSSVAVWIASVRGGSTGRLVDVSAKQASTRIPTRKLSREGDRLTNPADRRFVVCFFLFLPALVLGRCAGSRARTSGGVLSYRSSRSRRPAKSA